MHCEYHHLSNTASPPSEGFFNGKEMTLKTVTVAGQIYNPDGTPAAGVEGYATLNQPETDNGIVIPTSTFIKADADGKFSIQLWPNARGSGQSQYIVKAYTRRASVLNLVIMVPDVDVPVSIMDVAITPPYPPIDQSLQALLNAQEAAVIARAAKDEAVAAEAAALASRNAAAGSATAADQSARTADTKAQEAGASAQSALESKNAASLSEQSAGEAKDDAVAAKDKAEAWAENPVDAEVEAGQYSAKHHAIKAGESALSAAQSKAAAETAKGIAEEKALAASGSAASAGQSASNAAESALSASEDRIAAQQSAGQASGSADEAEFSKTKAQQWASNPENAPVEGSLYSALHYASKASTSAQNAADSADEALEYKNTAETAKTEAQSAREKAAQWAENPVDTEVEPGQYSAKHHASKAADSADNAEQSAQAAADSAASIEASVTAAPNKIPKSNESGKIDSDWLDQTVFIKDPLRQSAEASSGGAYTVVYTPLGQPNFLFRQPAFNLEDVAPGGELGTGLHPAFIFNGDADQEIFVGAYPASIVNGEVVCQPGRDPAASINFDNARAACQALGPGWDIMSNWDWAAIAFWCMANGFQPRGNTELGRNNDKRWETGTRVVSDAPGSNTNNNGRTLTGSGPAAWAHNNTPGGIHDLVGNVWELNQGLILDDNIFKVAPDNGTYLESEFIDTRVEAAANGAFFNRPYADPPLLLKQALAVPASAGLAPTGFFSKSSEGLRFAGRGGNWTATTGAGLGALNCGYLRTSTNAFLGFRPRFRNL